MALIKVGSMNQFALGLKETHAVKRTLLRSVRNVAAVNELSRTLDPAMFELITSADKRGLGLKSLKLTEGFDNFLFNLFKPDNEVYFIAWAWDLSGQPVNQYPGMGHSGEDVIVKLKAGSMREFIGEGINLFPKRAVTGGIAVRIQVWESDQDIRDFGKMLTDTADTIQKSELNNLLGMLATATGAPGATIASIEKAALELAKLIGGILKANSNDYVDLFEGYYAADQPWANASETYSANSSEIVLHKY